VIQVQNPAPRLSVLHALSQPSAFAIPAREGPGKTGAMSRVIPPQRSPSPTLSTSKRNGIARASLDIASPGRRRRQWGQPSSSPEPAKDIAASIVNGHSDGREISNGDATKGGDLSELETLFGLWKASGRSVNLWDWLEGFRDSHTDAPDAKMLEDAKKIHDPGDADVGGSPRRSGRIRDILPSVEAAPNGHGDEHDEETSERLHATFIRFCEEARMMGLVRARGKGAGRRADEGVKGVGLV